MTLRTRYSSLDMVRMGKFAKENPELKPIPLIKAYNEKYPEVTKEQKMKNIRNWLDDNDLMSAIDAPLQPQPVKCPSCFNNKVVAWGVNNEWYCPECGCDFEG